MPRAAPVQIVWLKRDLRVHDHVPLALAAAAGPVLPLHVVEPGYWRLPDTSGRQHAFLRDSLADLASALGDLGADLVVRRGEVVEVLEDLRQRLPVAALWSHEETGNGWTFARDRAVAGWARRHGIPWAELPQTGVIRRLASRDGWARRWDARMRTAVAHPPRALHPVDLDPGTIPTAAQLGLADDPCPLRQEGGRAAGLATLTSFLHERGRPYRRAMSAPGPGLLHCSRLSPHLALGTLSMREVLHATEARLRSLGDAPIGDRRGWTGSLRSLAGRLRWHCHFIQKLEGQPSIEVQCLHPRYEGLRGHDEGRLAAWSEGRTGWPFVDACMRSLDATGWLNFRMRAMLVAVASYQLWLDWRLTGNVLARRFTDYEPGIHWPQMQMQSGTTGINTIRMYNPVKQGRDQDPDGAFTRRWCPELAKVPLPWLHEPWAMPEAAQDAAGCRLGRDWPLPVVDHVAAARIARERVWAVRRGSAFHLAADAIQARHGSRRSGLPQPAGRRDAARRPDAGRQLDLDL